jgi:thioredoxin reductase
MAVLSAEGVTFDFEMPVVVVGAGACGLVAALAAHDAGQEVMVLERDEISFTRNDSDMLKFSKTSKVGFAKPEVWNVEIPFENAPNPHAILVQNFVNAILDGEPLIAPGEEGIHSVELANVILYSSLMEQTIQMPMDSAAYEKKLNQLIAESKLEKKVVEILNEDFTKSFRH